MNAPADLTNKLFCRLYVLNRSTTNTRGGKPRWDCICNCGTRCTVAAADLISGDTLSCGCYRKDRILRHGAARKGKVTAEYRSWHAMLQRCTNPDSNGYKNYGGRGIRVCKRWLKFENFLADMGPRPPGLTLDRRNNDGPYRKGNCRWATRKQQAQNRRKPGRLR